MLCKGYYGLFRSSDPRRQLLLWCTANRATPYQGEREAPGDGCSTLAAVQATGACSAAGQGMLCWHGHHVRVKAGGHVAQVYAICQSISKALGACYQKYDQYAEVADPDCCKTVGGLGAGAGYQKSYR